MDVEHVENVIGYKFRSKTLIFQALTAAGAEEENYDGCRKLSQIGASLVDVLLAVIVYGTGVDRSKIAQSLRIRAGLTLIDAILEDTHEMRKEFIDKNHYSLVAKQTGIDRCIKRNGRTPADSPEVHRKAINAIISAVLLDSWELRTVLLATMR